MSGGQSTALDVCLVLDRVLCCSFLITLGQMAQEICTSTCHLVVSMLELQILAAASALCGLWGLNSGPMLAQ